MVKRDTEDTLGTKGCNNGSSVTKALSLIFKICETSND